MPAPIPPRARNSSIFLQRRALFAAALALLIAGPIPGRASDAAEPLPVIASFPILADMTREVGGARVAATSLVAPGGDVHVFSPAPADAKRIAGAKLIVTNGLALEGWLPRLIAASGSKAPVIVASTGVDATRLDEATQENGHGHGGHGHGQEQEHGHGEEHDHGGLDPHAWQNVANARIYVRNIRDGLISADPDGRATYERNAAAYTARLEALDAEIRQRMAAIPADRRRIITTHDAFGYFGRAYGLALTAPQGLSTESEASAADVARVIRQIRSSGAPAVFLENVSDPRLMDRIARETGVKVGGRLFTDSLSAADGPAPTYIGMMRHNVDVLEKALKP